MRERFGLRLRVALFFASLGLGGAALFAAALWLGWARAGGPAEGFLIAGVVGGFAILGLSTWIGFLFDENMSRPILALAGDLKSRAAADMTSDINEDPGRYLGALAPSAAAIHRSLLEAREERAAAIQARTAQLEREKALLAALLQELSQAVLVISGEGRILLFNQAAEDLLGALSLERRVERFLDVAPLEASLARGEKTARAFLTAAKRGDGQLLSGTLQAFGTEDEVLGQVLVFQGATERFEIETKSSGAVERLLESARRPTMNMSALLEVALSTQDGEGARGPLSKSLAQRLRSETDALVLALETASAEVDGTQRAAWPRGPQNVGALFDGRALAGAQAPTRNGSLVLSIDPYAIGETLSLLSAQVAAQAERDGLTWHAEPLSARRAELRLEWRGPNFDQVALDHLLEAPLFAPYQRFTLAEALRAQEADIWMSRQNCLRLEVPRAAEENRRPKRGSEEFFQFPLAEDMGRLADMCFVVFDTETTGLDTQKDEVVQLAGMRLLRGRLMESDVFDSLVNPGRSIPPSATAIHKVSDAMVADARPFKEVGADFADFVEDAVLVAHNARFDQAFLERLAINGGPRIESPVLCTARLSLALDPHLNDHTLDAVAHRYGVEIKENDRHTARGDARATAEVFRKMLPMLEKRDVGTLEDALLFQERA
ncbi:MAG: exonuclease domain-containing protein [Pseudomonadota bacterium]